jgi:nucleoside-diphosphate-sugar epimerase
VGEHLAATRGYPLVEIPTPYYSTWLDNTKIKLQLGWRPAYDWRRLVDESFDFRRDPDDSRKEPYPG